MTSRLRPPREPTPGECCGSGCSRCVWDVYYDDLARYNQWLATHGSSSSDDPSEYDEEDYSSDSSEEEENYIGSVVIKYLNKGDGNKGAVASNFVDEDLAQRYVEVNNVVLRKSSYSDSEGDQMTVNILSLSTAKPIPAPNPGDVVELYVPNGSPGPGDVIASVCSRLGVRPDDLCELHRSPFVPEDHFPPWLPLRKAMTVRQLLTYYVDISSSSYLLRPSFFQSLLRVHENRKTSTEDICSDVETLNLLKECASLQEGPKIFRAITNRGKPLCYPSLVDVLDAFPFVKLPLDRLLEISGPLRPRKLSIAGLGSMEKDHISTFEICLRKVMTNRNSNAFTPDMPEAASKLATLLNGSAERRAGSGELPTPLFCGHASYPLCNAGRAAASHGSMAIGSASSPAKFFVGTSLFGTSIFGRELKRVLQQPISPSAKIFLIGAGTGIAPLMAAVEELLRLRRGEPTPSTGNHSTSITVSPFQVWYGARNHRELIYHDILSSAAEMRAIESYQYALSRSAEPDQPHDLVPHAKYVTDIMRSNAQMLKESLMNAQGKLFACGPSPVLSSIRGLLETILEEPDDDDSMKEQRVLLLEEKQQVLFDVWSTVKEF